MNPEAFAAVFDQYPGHVFTGFDEYIGYLHTGMQTSSARGAGIEIKSVYDPHFGRALIAKGSEWRLHLSDWLRETAHPSDLRINGAVSVRSPGEWTPVRLSKCRLEYLVSIH